MGDLTFTNIPLQNKKYKLQENKMNDTFGLCTANSYVLNIIA
jgi:hypothetical protein